MTVECSGSCPGCLLSTIYLPRREYSVSTEKPVTVTVDKIVYRQRWWQQALSWVGAVAILLLVIKIIIKI